jgi:hypothetical protein
MRNILQLVAAVTLWTWCSLVSGAIAVFTLDELTARSRYVFVAEVDRIASPNWKDEQGNEIVLAEVTVVHAMKGQIGPRAVIAFKANVADQEQMQSRQRYVIFSFGSNSALLMGHQLRAFPVDGDEVSSATLKGEPTKQPLGPFEQRVERLVNGMKFGIMS